MFQGMGAVIKWIVHIVFHKIRNSLIIKNGISL